MTVLACASHFLIDMPLFGAPVLFVVGAILLIRRSERRRDAAESDAESLTGSESAQTEATVTERPLVPA